MKEALARVNDLTVQPHSPEDYVVLDWHLLRAGDSLRLRAYYTDKVVLQGKRSALAAEVERALEAEMLRAGLDYHVPSSPRPVTKKQIDDAEEDVLEMVGDDALIFIGSELLHALAYSWHQVKNPPEGVQNVSFLLGPALPAFERFWLQFATRLDSVESGDSQGVGRWARQFLNDCERRRDAKGKNIARRLMNAWDLRNKIAHASGVVLDQRKCHEELLKWLELMRDAQKWMQKT